MDGPPNVRGIYYIVDEANTMMAFWDLKKAEREELKTALIARQSMIDRDIIPPENIRILRLMKKYSMTVADMESLLKGNFDE